jgi:uncharacterized phage protein gp47/JayE
MTAELNENGLTVQTLAEIKTEIQERYKALFGVGIQLADDTNAGKIISLYSDREAQTQEALEGVYWSQYLSTAAGVSLDFVLERMGLQRQSALPSTLTQKMFAAGTPSTAVSSEALRMSVDGTGEIFFNSSAFTLGSLVDESVNSITRSGSTATVTISGGHSFPLDSWVFITGAEQEEYNGLHQITAIAATTFDYEIVGTLPVSPATGTITAKEATPFDARSEKTGPIQALAGAITTIEAAVPGVAQVENSDDATLGRNVETDTEARARAYESLGITGSATQKAITAKMLNIDGVTFATVFQNVTDFVDANGLPPHSIRVVVDGGADADIWTTLYEEAVAAGIQMTGTETTTITDDNGDNQPVAFSRPTSVRIYVDAGNGLVKNTDPAQGAIFPADGEDQIKANLAAIVFDLGGDVWPAKIKEAINKVDGVEESDPEFEDSTPPTNKATIAIAAASRANIDSDDVTFT